ncbi:MAG TPA: hypothetical protein V6D26_01385 [Stenomitos sp.]
MSTNSALPAPQLGTQVAATSTINVTYNGFTSEAQAAFQYAVDIWETLIQSPVTINVQANWAALGTKFLGQAKPTELYKDFSGAPVSNTLYPVALANALAGRDLNSKQADITASFSSDVNWYFGTDGNTPTGQYDFVTVALHELGHGLGFYSSMNVTPNSMGQSLGSWGSSNSPYIFDRFIENNAGQNLINTTLFPQNSTQLGNELTSNNVFFDASITTSRNDNVRPRLYAPNPWEGGSSISHLDDGTYDGTINALMTHDTDWAEAVHQPGPITFNMFRDMGWSMNTEGWSYGTPRNDSLIGTAAAQNIYGLEGIDTLDGGAGNDFINGGADNDDLYGGTGNDTLDGSEGDDYQDGWEGDDILYGGTGNDVLVAWTGNDILKGEADNDWLDGAADNDTLYGGEGNDTLGNAFLQGEAGDDKMYGEGGNDKLYGGTGNDSLDGGIGSDTMYGGTDDDYLDGWEGDDILYGGNDIAGLNSGNDVLVAWKGNDTLYGGDGNDWLDGSYNNDALYGGDGNDTLIGYGGGTERDTLVGGANADQFVLGTSAGAFYFGDGSTGYATIVDFHKNSQGDKIIVYGIKDDYRLDTSHNFSGGSTNDTAIYYKNDLIAVVEDKIYTSRSDLLTFGQTPF